MHQSIKDLYETRQYSYLANITQNSQTLRALHKNGTLIRFLKVEIQLVQQYIPKLMQEANQYDRITVYWQYVLR